MIIIIIIKYIVIKLKYKIIKDKIKNLNYFFKSYKIYKILLNYHFINVNY